MPHGKIALNLIDRRSHACAAVGLILFILSTDVAVGLPLRLERVGGSLLTSPYALTTSQFHHDEQDGDRYSYNIGFDTYAADFSGEPKQWVIDSILETLGYSDIADVLAISDAWTVSRFSSSLRLTGEPGDRAEVSVSPYVSGFYSHIYAAIPSAEASSQIRFDYWIGAWSLSGDEEISWSNSGLARWSSGSSDPPNSVLPSFQMTVGDVVNVIGELSVRSVAEVNPVCAWVIWRDICVAGVGVAFSQTGGEGGIELQLSAIPTPVPEPGTLALLGLGLAGLGLSRRRRNPA